MTARTFDVVVVGLGHAGAEAALAVRRLGGRVAAVTQVPGRACLMSCNPAVGGPGKSQLVREIDALGGAMALAADSAAIQVRLLNRSKGPASWATRLQVDRAVYAAQMQRLLWEAGVAVIGGEAARLEIADARLQALLLADGSCIPCGAVVLTTGTFLSARMHVGRTQTEGGRAGDLPSDALAQALSALGLRLGRFKTGTPPRLEGRTIDYGRCTEQPSETEVGPLSRRTQAFPALAQRSTFATATNERTHEVVRSALEDSPLTTGAVRSKGPRYCPSLEQKVLHYPDRLGHVVYLEPDGLSTSEVYPAGLSTSLPITVQLELLRTIKGLEQVELRRPGYAVEYDYLLGGQLRPTLEHAQIAGLFFAGQINGSSGYEEAAAQGLVAGVNALRRLRDLSPWVPSRADSYIGVLCDDLCRQTQGEPYRVLPSKAEDRLRLREDNAAHRLNAIAASLDLIPAATAEKVRQEVETVARLRNALSDADIRRVRSPALTEDAVLAELWPMEKVSLARLAARDLRYAPYEEQRRIAGERLQKLLAVPVDPAVKYEEVRGLSTEAREILTRERPISLGAAVALPGMTDAAVSVLAAHLRLREKLKDVSRGTTR